MPILHNMAHSEDKDFLSEQFLVLESDIIETTKCHERIKPTINPTRIKFKKRQKFEKLKNQKIK